MHEKKLELKGNAIRIYEDMEGICLEMIKKLIKKKNIKFKNKLELPHFLKDENHLKVNTNI